uniref:UMOD/GP2/OIT3-like D8C domain-containing protein n=1 Tax=Poecilia reticulata TaxID=8081 RepID=A0A3P9P8P5_POERE
IPTNRFVLFLLFMFLFPQCADPCSRYTELREDWRSVNNVDQSNVRCDQWVNWDGWYRFYLGGSSAAIPEKCVPSQRCGTHASLYITEPNPTQTSDVVTRTVCNNWSSSCCYFASHTIKVKLCPGNFYVYKLAKPSVCHLGYCAAHFHLLAKIIKSYISVSIKYLD